MEAKDLVIGGVYLFELKKDSPILMILDEVLENGVILVADEDSKYEYGYLVPYSRISNKDKFILVSKNENLNFYNGSWEVYNQEK